MNYTSAAERLGSRPSRKIDNNTYLQRRDENTIAVKLHATDIVTFHADGRIVLNSGGWQTLTTKERISNFSPVSIWQRNRVWSFNHNGETYLYADGVTLNADGTVTGAKSQRLADAEEKQRKAIRQYAKAFSKKLVEGNLPRPSGADCWFCALVDSSNGKPLGEGDRDHLNKHVTEKYYVPSLLVNAVKTCTAYISRYSLHELSSVWNGNAVGNADVLKRDVENVLTRYLYAELGVGPKVAQPRPIPGHPGYSVQ